MVDERGGAFSGSGSGENNWIWWIIIIAIVIFLFFPGIFSGLGFGR